MNTNTNFVLLNGDINHTSKDIHNRAFKFSVYNKDDLEIKMLKAEIESKTKMYEEMVKLYGEKLEECENKTRECEEKDEMYSLIKEEYIKVLEEKEKVTEELGEKTKECKAKDDENKELKKENEKLNEMVVAGRTEIAILDKAFNDYRSQPKVRRLKAKAVKEIIEMFTIEGGILEKEDIINLAMDYNVTVKTIVNLYSRKTHAKAWLMLDSRKLWVIKQGIINLV